MTGPIGRVLVVVGTRPEAIKLAPVMEALRGYEDLEVRLALTGQHSTLVDEALAVFGLVPDHDLAIMREGQTVAEVARGCLEGMGPILRLERPDLLLVQGDTASVFFAALAAWFEAGIAIGHVEAGLRTGDLRHPFPEEGFRRLTAVLTDLHFAPTSRARDHLLSEGVPADRIHVTGNTVVDALLRVHGAGRPPHSPVLSRLLGAGAPPFLLLTTHRRESFGAPLAGILGAVRQLVDEEPGLEVLAPLHPNPQVLGPARQILGGHARIHLVEPLGYPDLVSALAGARAVLTDSGGLQEEAPTFGTPVVVLRDRTERPEGIEAGAARLAGTDPERILAACRAVLRTSPDRPDGEEASGGRVRNPYGDGRAGERIARIVHEFLLARRRTYGGGGFA